MTPLPSLPGRPLTATEVEGLEDADRVSRAITFAAHFDGVQEFALQVVLDLGDVLVALHFDPYEETWAIAGEAETLQEISASLMDARGQPAH